MRSRGRSAGNHLTPIEIRMETITLHAYFDRHEVRPPRQLCGPDKPSRTWSAFEERTMTEVREGSWAIAQLLAPVHRYEGASRRSLRKSRKSCAHSVSSVKLSEKPVKRGSLERAKALRVGRMTQKSSSWIGWNMSRPLAHFAAAVGANELW